MSSISARIPTVQYGYLEVEGANPGELLDMVRHDSLEELIEELRLIDAEQNVKNAVHVESTSREKAPWDNDDTPPADTGQRSSGRGSGQYGRRKQEANVQEGSNDGPPICDHGKPMVFKSKDTGGRGGNGWRAWMCDGTRDRDDQCKPIFLN